jgi:hypothetical protein
MNGRWMGSWAVAVCAVAVSLNVAAVATAEELATDAERLWRDLRSSSDVRTKLLAERWYNVVKLQEWSNDTGKFTTNAKYLEHDPDLGWVKLRIIQGTGRERVVKEVTIPLAKLSKTCQARVRQIHALSAKLAEAKVEEEKRKAEEKDGTPTSEVREGDMRAEELQEGREGNRRDRRGRGEFDDASAGVNPEDALTQDPSAAPSEPAANAGVSSTPLPALSPGLPTTRILSAATGEEGTSPQGTAPVSVERISQQMVAAAPSSDGFKTATPLADTPNLIDQDPWRTDYEAFRTVFQPDETGTIVTREEWPGVKNLQLFTPIPILQAQDRGEPPAYMAEPRLVEVGGFQWEGVVAQQPSGEGNWTEVLGLAPLVEPLKLELRLEDGGRSGDWQRLQTGDRVRFVGQFVGYRGPYCWVAAIRILPDASERR